MKKSIEAVKYLPLSQEEENLGAQIIDSAITIHKYLGPGLLESIYEKCFCYELEKRHVHFIKQAPAQLKYDNVLIDDGLRMDILVNDLIVVELKAHENYHPVWEAQLLSYLKLSGKRLGFLLNFHVPIMKQGIKRIICNNINAEKPQN